MAKYTEHRTKQPMDPFAFDDRPGFRREPLVNLLIELIGDDGQADEIMAEAIRELFTLRRRQAEITTATITQVVSRAKNSCRAHPISVSTGPYRSRLGVKKGRFADIDVLGPVVYYMRVGNRVKIGVTSNLRGRLENFNPEEFLGYERGSLGLERQRHRQFAALRVNGEWFEYGDAIKEHVKALRSET